MFDRNVEKTELLIFHIKAPSKLENSPKRMRWFIKQRLKQPANLLYVRINALLEIFSCEISEKEISTCEIKEIFP